MIQIIGAILFIVPAILIIQAVRTNSGLKSLPDIIITAINGALLTMLTSSYLVIWSWSGNNRSLVTYAVLSVGISAVSLAATGLLALIIFVSMRLTGRRVRVTWYPTFIQVLLANIIMATFTIVLPFWNAQREKTYQEKRTVLEQKADSVPGETTAELKDGGIQVTLGLPKLTGGTYSMQLHTKITANMYAANEQACVTDREERIEPNQQSITLEIPYDFIRGCLNRNRIAADNAILNGIIVTVMPTLSEGAVSTSLSPVSIGKWIDITATKTAITAQDRTGNTKDIGW